MSFCSRGALPNFSCCGRWRAGLFLNSYKVQTIVVSSTDVAERASAADECVSSISKKSREVNEPKDNFSALSREATMLPQAHDRWSGDKAQTWAYRRDANE
jgi:hypothetical protein